MKDLVKRGSARGYFPDRTKIILVISEQNFPQEREYFQGMGLKVATRIQWMGGFIGKEDT